MTGQEVEEGPSDYKLCQGCNAERCISMGGQLKEMGEAVLFSSSLDGTSTVGSKTVQDERGKCSWAVAALEALVGNEIPMVKRSGTPTGKDLKGTWRQVLLLEKNQEPEAIW